MSSDTAELLRQHVQAVAKLIAPEKADRKVEENRGSDSKERPSNGGK